MGRFRFIFCEGNRDSWDKEVLEKIIASTQLIDIEVVPVGGKGSLANFRDGYVKGNRLVKEDVQSLGFRDRDFDFPVPEKPQLIKAGNNIYASYRTTIENYLLNPKQLFQFIQEKEHLDKLKESSRSLEGVKTIFRETALELKYYAAARCALGEVRKSIRLDTTWRSRSGDLPDDLSREHCLNEAIQLVQYAASQASSYTIEAITKSFERFLERFDEEFFQNESYLIWFNAKDLQTLLKPKLFVTDFSFKGYYKYSLEHFQYTQFPDLWN
ncbi:MAG: DUF4435 domain-containing protein [Phaeodactylibacter sp.]|nr:DUF4435 domain-containing protein [Phaeodactylibacter sp.]